MFWLIIEAADAIVCRHFTDGKFSNEYEQLSVDITEADSGRRLSGQEKSRLKQDKVYIVSARVPETYYGCITWKLEIMQTDNPYIRSSKKGYTKLKTESPAAEISILQIYLSVSHCLQACGYSSKLHYK